MVRECGGTGVLRVGPSLVVAQRRRPGLEGVIARLGAGKRRVDPFLRGLLAVRSDALVEEDQAAAVLALELGPARASRIVAFVEERPREERRTLLVVTDDQSVLGRAAETEHERGQVAVDRLLR